MKVLSREDCSTIAPSTGREKGVIAMITYGKVESVVSVKEAFKAAETERASRHVQEAEKRREKAKEANLSDSQISLLLERVENLPEGAIIIPASQDVMDKHDGWDYDGDHVQIDLDPRMVEIVKSTITIIVHIMEDDEFQSKLEH